jgi:ribonucleoside-diphosphate reductase alpha chain
MKDSQVEMNEEDMSAPFIEPISSMIWDLKYRYRQGEQAIDQNMHETWQRTAKAAASVETDKARWEQIFLDVLTDFRFLPGGRILAGAGTTHQVTLFNCFVMNIAEDSMTGIFQALTEGALTLQQGGGVGYDFSVLRPYGDLAKRTGIPASGPVSFMRIWDTTCGVLLSTGARRGAMMGVLRCDHPDIEAFIAAKADSRELRHFNVSVMVSDGFMQAVATDAKWALVFPVEGKAEGNDIVYRRFGQRKTVPCRVYRTVQARELWQKIIRAAYDYAEPGVLFEDTINRMNNLWYREYIAATNPCGEIPLPIYGACNLGTVNLTQFITEPFSDQATIQWKNLLETVQVGTRFLDNIINVSHYPLPAQREEALGTRRIGLGVTGLADALVMLNIPYGSEKSISIAKEIMQKVAEITWQTSIELAKEKGKFLLYTDDYWQGEFVKTLPMILQNEIKQHGVRNSHHNTIAPAGTISLLANNISNGIEPIFKAQYQRSVRGLGNESSLFTVKDYAYHLWSKDHSGLPTAWVDTDVLTPEAHLAVQGAMQPFIDNAISKTINLPADFPFEQLTDIYTKAYQLGLKGCTIFRPNPITGSVLQAISTDEEAADERCCQI